MPMKKAPPGSGGGRRTHFPYVATARGAKWTAYIAGPCQWVLTHEVNRKTKVCVEWLTDKELICEHCHHLKELRETGYQPLYRQSDGRPVLVVVHEDVRDQIDKLKFHSRVQVAREREASAGLYLTTLLEQEPRYQSTLAERHASPDLTSSLLALWGIAALKDWYARGKGRSDTAVSLSEGVAMRDDGQPYSPGMQAAAKRYGAPVVTDGPSADAFDAVKQRLMNTAAQHEQNKNGKTPKKG